MEIDFDPRKDLINRSKHGLSLSLARELQWDEALCWIDERFPYPEARMSGLVPRGDRMYHVTFIDHNDHYRIISLRHAERSEIRIYMRDRHN